jgi:hypothetical protein
MAVNPSVWVQHALGATRILDAHPRRATLVFDLDRLVRRRALEGADACGMPQRDPSQRS